MDTDWIIIIPSIFLLCLLLYPSKRRRKSKQYKSNNQSKQYRSHRIDLDSVNRFQNAEYANKGEWGEFAVSTILLNLSNEYHVFNDVYLETKGHSSQIDHVVISQYGVFVIETKNYSGDIYGSEDAKQWTQYLQGEGYKFHNPIAQNHSHELAIKNTLHVAPASIIPIVVFLGGAVLHCNTKSAVLYARQLSEYILRQREIRFTQDGVERLTERLSKAIITDPDRKENHVWKVQLHNAERKLLIDNHICPQCNGKLVERQGKYGTFLACSNYPHCKFTVQI